MGFEAHESLKIPHLLPYVGTQYFANFKAMAICNLKL